MTVPRNHHYIAQAYLGGFTREGTKEGKIHVFDAKEMREFVTKPKKVNGLRDFYRIASPTDGTDPLALERLIGSIEDRGMAVIRSIEKQERAPTPAELRHLLEFIALQAARGPDVRDRLDRTLGNIRSGIVPLLSSMHRVHVQGKSWDPGLEAWRKETLDGELPTLSQDDHLAAMQKLYQIEFDDLLQLNSLLVLLPEGSPDLACSDSPYTCVDTRDGRPSRTRPLNATLILMALSRRLLWQGLRGPASALLQPGGELVEHFVKLSNQFVVHGARLAFKAHPGLPYGIKMPRGRER